MKKAFTTRTFREEFKIHETGKSTDQFLIPDRIPGIDVPGYGKHYQSLALQGPMGRRPEAWRRDGNGYPDPGLWNRGGVRWLHTKRRGGQIGRQRERRLPLAPFPE